MKQRFEDHQGLINMQAMYGLKWAHAAGVDILSYDDMFQEACLAFLAAAEGFDPNKQTFSAYYTKAAFCQFRVLIGKMNGVKNINPTQREEIKARKEENARRAAAAEPPLPDIDYGIKTVGGNTLACLDDYCLSLELADGQTPELQLERKQNVLEATSKLSPLAQLVVEWLCSPPPELLHMIEGWSAYADQCEAMNVRIPTGSRAGLGVDSIKRFMGALGAKIDNREFRLVKLELDAMVKELEG